jgi:hypothetical protein
MYKSTQGDPKMRHVQSALAAAALFLVTGARQQAPKADEVDLLALIDPELDSVEGAWQKSGKTLVTPVVPFARLQLPYLPPEEYDLTIVAELKGAPESLNIGIPVGGRQITAVLDGWKGTRSGFHLIDGKQANENETSVPGRVFSQNTPARILCSVRKGRLSVSVDGKALLDWKVDPERFSHDDAWAVRDREAPYIGCYAASFHITELMLKPVSGKGRLAPTQAKRTKFVGGSGGGAFEVASPAPGILIGLRGTISTIDPDAIVGSVQPLFRIGYERREGAVQGVPGAHEFEVVARPGYAVGAIVAKGRNRVTGFRAIFMRIEGAKLLSSDSYESLWIGGRLGGEELRLGGDGRVIAGLYGRQGADVDNLGLLYGEVSPADLDPARPYLERMKDPSAELRRHACASLAVLTPGAPWLIPALMDALGDKDGEVRATAEKALRREGVISRVTGPFLRLRPGDRFAVKDKVRLVMEGNDPLSGVLAARMHMDIEYTLDFEVEGVTGRGVFELEGIYSRLKAVGTIELRPAPGQALKEEKLAFEWDGAKQEDKGEGAGRALAESFRSMVKAPLKAQVDPLGRVLNASAQNVSNLSIHFFTGSLLVMGGSLPEGEKDAEGAWRTEGMILSFPAILEHRAERRDEREWVIATTVAPDLVHATSEEHKGVIARAKDPRDILRGSATTTFDPAAGLPVKAKGKGKADFGHLKMELEFESLFEKQEDGRVRRWQPLLMSPMRVPPMEITLPASEIHGSFCGHYSHAGKWYVLAGHIHGPACGHAFREGVWTLPLVK